MVIIEPVIINKNNKNAWKYNPTSTEISAGLGGQQDVKKAMSKILSDMKL